MKIFWSFNTKLDEHELYEAIQKNGQWNAIMMKKHWIYLIRPLIRMLFAFAAFGLLIYFAYHQFYKDYKLLFWIITLAYSLVTLFRCLHSLSMILHDILDQKNNKNWYVETVSQSEFKEWRYEKFLKHTIISMCLQVLLMIGCSIASFSLWNITWTGILLSIIGIIVNIWFLFLLYKVLDRKLQEIRLGTGDRQPACKAYPRFLQHPADLCIISHHQDLAAGFPDKRP